MNRKFHPQPLFIILHCRHLNAYYIWMCVYNVDFRTVEIILTDIRVNGTLIVLKLTYLESRPNCIKSKY